MKKTTLKEYGAVSEKTAKEMAKNGAFITGSDACVSVTGTARTDRRNRGEAGGPCLYWLLL